MISLLQMIEVHARKVCLEIYLIEFKFVLETADSDLIEMTALLDRGAARAITAKTDFMEFGEHCLKPD